MQPGQLLGDDMQSDRVVAQIDYVASEHLRDVVASLGRTEDVRFSPNNRRLAVAGFFRNKITVFDVSIATSRGSKSIALTGATEISSTHLNNPHGLDFIDDEKIVVANREGNVCVFELPNEIGKYELAPAFVIRSENASTPGSVAVIKNGDGVYEALICNNYAHTVTRHPLVATDSTKNNEVLLKKWLDIPDGVSVSRNKEWIAISNHDTHTVLLYENRPSLNESSHPDGILRGTNYPHGLRFTSDGRFILVADAGSPYVNIYQKEGSDWRGVGYPFISFRVLNNQDFLRGQQHNPREGGPKGVDTNDAMNLIVTTCESQPLAFFDFGAILEGACEERSSCNSNYSLSNSRLHEQKALEVIHELAEQERVKELAKKLQQFQNSKFWRITAPLRQVHALLGWHRRTEI